MTDTLIAPASAPAATAAGAAVVVEADGRTASNDALHVAIEEAVRRGAPLRVLHNGAPDLAVEIISPSSRQHDTNDTVEKLVNYGRFGVQEYWLVDPVERSVTLYGNVGGQLVVIPPAEGVLNSRVLPGFWLRAEWLFPPEGEDRPGELEIARLQGLI